jgi:hypothetical protein
MTAIDPVTTDPKGEVGRAAESPRIHAPHNTPALTQDKGAYGAREELEPWFVTGLTEGEGCFCISFARRAKMKTGLEVRPSFSLSLNEKDLPLLGRLQAFFSCGWVRESKADRTFKYECRSVTDLSTRIVPHFLRYPLRGSKARSFAGFMEVCRMVGQGDHLRREGLERIIAVAYDINVGRRRYSREELLRALGEVKG